MNIGILSYDFLSAMEHKNRNSEEMYWSLLHTIKTNWDCSFQAQKKMQEELHKSIIKWSIWLKSSEAFENFV